MMGLQISSFFTVLLGQVPSPQGLNRACSVGAGGETAFQEERDTRAGRRGLPIIDQLGMSKPWVLVTSPLPQDRDPSTQKEGT